MDSGFGLEWFGKSAELGGAELDAVSWQATNSCSEPIIGGWIAPPLPRKLT